MIETRVIDAEDPSDEIAALVRTLHDTQQRLQELAGGEVDAVVHPGGHSYLLHEAQEKLRRSEATQHDLAATQSSILDALPAHIALLDHDGVILSVNEGWHRSARNNTLGDSASGVGENYVEVCERAEGQCSEAAHEAAAGMRAVLSGAARQFSLEYPCGSPTDQRWFRLRVNPIENAGMRGAVAMHVDITQGKLAEEAVRRSEAEFRLLAEALPQMVWITRADGWTTFFNQQWMDYTGLTLGESLGHGWNKPFHPDDQQRSWDAWQEATTKRARYSIECRLRRADGEYRWWLVRGIPQQDAAGNILKWFGTCTDIHEIKIAEEAVRASEASMATAQSIAHFGSWELDLNNQDDVDANPLRWSDEMFRIAGYAPGAVAISNEFFFRHVPAEEHEAIRQAIGGAIRDLRPYSVVHRLRRPDGEERIVHERGKIALDQSTGQPTKVLGTAHDITERRQADAAVRASEEKFRAVADQSLQGLVLVQDGITTFVNQAFCDIIGYSMEEALTHTPAQRFAMIHPDNSARVLERETRFKRGEPIDEVEEIRIIRKDGAVRWVLSSNKTFPLQGKPARLGIILDITERKQAERLVHESEERLSFAMEAAGIGDWNLDLRTNVAHRSLRHDQCFGYAEQLPEWGYDTFLAHIAPADRDRVDAGFRKAMAGEGEYDEEFRAPWPDGSVHWLWTRGRFYFDETGEPYRVAGIVFDVSERERAAKALRESQERLALATQSVHLGIWEWSVVTNQLVWDDAMYVLYGVRKEDFSGAYDAWQNGVHPDDRERAAAELFAAVEGDAGFHTEFRIVRPGGEVRDIEAHAVMHSADNGSSHRMIGVNRDITERKQAEREVRLNEQRYRSLVEATTSIVWDTPASGEFEVAQQGWSTFTGQSFAELRGWGWLQAIHPDDQQETARVWAAAVAGRSPYEVEHRLRRHDQTWRHMQVRAVPILDEHGTIREWIGIHTDITERKRSEERIAEQAALIELSPDGILIHEAWRVTFANSAAMRLLGARSPEELLGLDPRTFADPDSTALARERERAILEGKELGLVEMRWVGVDGVRRTVEVISRPIKNHSGILTIFRDATARIQLETELRQSQKMDALGRLAGGIAHDFNNLLGVMMSYTGILLEELPPADPIRSDLAEVQMAIDRAASLTNQLLAFGRQQPRRPVRVDLRDALRSSVGLARRLIGEDIAIITSVADDPLPVVVDVNHLEQVLLNLAVNARDAMPSGGHLSMSASRSEVSDGAAAQTVPPGKYACITVSDTGVGIDPDVMQNMFDPFFTTKDVGKGTGLGLATVYAIVTQSGGFLTVTSELGNGATFTVYLPLVEATTDEHAVVIPAERVIEATHRAVILFVEDEATLRVVTERILRKCGFDVVSAATPAEAIELVRDSALVFDCLVTDVVMPGMSGAELAERIRVIRGAIPVLLLSGFARDHLESRGNIDADMPMLNKPVRAADLARAIGELLRGERVTMPS